MPRTRQQPEALPRSARKDKKTPSVLLHKVYLAFSRNQSNQKLADEHSSNLSFLAIVLQSMHFEGRPYAKCVAVFPKFL